VRSRIIACFGVMSLAAALSNEPARAENTHPQHQDWIRKLETPGGTFPYALEEETSLGESSPLGSSGTAYQHRSWIKKLETPNGTLGTSF
jgi:hypothetical protein